MQSPQRSEENKEEKSKHDKKRKIGRRQFRNDNEDKEDDGRSRNVPEQIKSVISFNAIDENNYDFFNNPIYDTLINNPLVKDESRLKLRSQYLKKQACFIDYILRPDTPIEIKKRLIMRPIPKWVGNLQLSIIRNNSGFNKFYPKYTLVIKLAREEIILSEKEILVGKKRSGNKTSNYLISLNINNPKPFGDGYIGKLRAADKKKNAYYLYDHGENPKDTPDRSKWRTTLASISFGSQ